MKYDKITRHLVVDAFYLADRQDEHIIDDVIAGWTGLFPCNWGTIAASHEERGYFIDGKLWFFSSTSRPELGTSHTDGTRWIEADTLLRSPERWALRISRPMTDREIEREISRANGLLGMRYDMIGVVLDFIRPGLVGHQRKKIYCSKACHFLQTGKYKRISPRRRSKYVKKHGYQPISVAEVLTMQH